MPRRIWIKQGQRVEGPDAHCQCETHINPVALPSHNINQTVNRTISRYCLYVHPTYAAGASLSYCTPPSCRQAARVYYTSMTSKKHGRERTSMQCNLLCNTLHVPKRHKYGPHSQRPPHPSHSHYDGISSSSTRHLSGPPNAFPTAYQICPICTLAPNAPILLFPLTKLLPTLLFRHPRTTPLGPLVVIPFHATFFKLRFAVIRRVKRP